MARSDRLSYANVTASLALFVALGGGAYAASTIDSADVVNGSLTGTDVKNESIRSRDVKALRAKDFAAGQLPAGATGPQGPAGAKGDQGVPGPIAGTPAGGVLSGTYPNPGLAAGAVGPNALAALPGARANAGLPSIANNESTVDLVTETYDTGGMYTAGDDFITVQRTGTYLVTGSLHWNGAGTDERQIRIKRDEGTVDEDTLQLVDQTNDTDLLTQQVHSVVRLTTGDKISLQSFQDSGAAVATANFVDEPGAWIAVQYVSG